MEDFVTFEQAIKLKELGFDWECYQFYNDDKKLWSYTSIGYGDDCRNWNDDDNAAIGNSECSAPTLSQAQKWLREVKNIIIGIDFDNYSNKFTCHCYNKLKIVYSSHLVLKDDNDFDTYEQALSAGIDKALELLK